MLTRLIAVLYPAMFPVPGLAWSVSINSVQQQRALCFNNRIRALSGKTFSGARASHLHARPHQHLQVCLILNRGGTPSSLRWRPNPHLP